MGSGGAEGAVAGVRTNKISDGGASSIHTSGSVTIGRHATRTA